MSSVKIEAAKELIREGKYTEARAILLTVDDPFARQLIERIDLELGKQSPTVPTPKKGNFLRDVAVVGCIALFVVIAFCVVLVVLVSKPSTLAPVAVKPTTAVATASSAAFTNTSAPTTAHLPTDAPSPVPPTDTAIPTDTPGPTVSPRNATATFVAMYAPISRGELISYTDKHQGDFVKITGRVFHVIDDKDLQLLLAGSSSDAVYVASLDPYSGIYENDFVTVYAMVDGYATGTNAFGGDVKQPLLDNAVVVK